MNKNNDDNKYGTRVYYDDTKQSKLKAIRRAEEINKPGVFLISQIKDKGNREFLKSSIPIDEEWKEFLKKNEWSRFYEGKEDIGEEAKELRKILLDFAGDDVCLRLGREGKKDIKELLKRGQLWIGKNAMMKRGEAGHCHCNSASLWDVNKDNMDIRICTGYALSDDGMWREHSWLVLHNPRSNQIIETTVKRVAYFGFVLTDKESEIAVEDWIW